MKLLVLNKCGKLQVSTEFIGRVFINWEKTYIELKAIISRPSRLVTELLQTSFTNAEFDEKAENDLHFEVRGCTPEHKSSLQIRL